MKLYEISEHYNAALLGMAEMDDLPQEAIDDTLEGIEGEFKDKAINVAAFIKNLEADVKAIKEAEKAMACRRKSLESQAERLTHYLLMQMQMTGITKICDSPYFAISLKKNPPKVVVDDEGSIPVKFIAEKVTQVIDKKSIGEALKSGKEISGAHIEQEQRVEIK